MAVTARGGQTVSGAPTSRARASMTSSATPAAPLTARQPGLMMAAFSVATEASVVPRYSWSIQAHVGDGSHIRGPRVRGIEPAAQAHLHDQRVHPPAGRPQPGRRGQELELRGRTMLSLARLAGAQDLLQQLIQVGSRDGPSVDEDALAVAVQVRARRLSRRATRRLEHRCHHGGHAALAVGAAHEHAAERSLRVAKLRQEGAHALEAESDADRPAGADAGQGVGRHVRRPRCLPHRRRTG